jgi:Immunity protein 45
LTWVPLSTLREPIGRGSRLRLQGEYPYESIVEFLVFDGQGEGLGLIVDTGYKAGLIAVVFPKESLHPRTGMLSAQWLIDNCGKWIFPPTRAEDIMVDVEGRTAQTITNSGR